MEQCDAERSRWDYSAAMEDILRAIRCMNREKELSALIDPKHISVIGAGNIGTGLAILFSVHGLPVTVMGVNATDLERSRAICSSYFATLLHEGLMTKSEIEASTALIGYSTSYEDIAHTDFVYEGVLETPEVKWAVYQEIEKNCPHVKAIASTTSAITPDILVKGLTKYRDRLVVAHPWNPPHMVPFVEMVAGEACRPEAVEFVRELLTSVGRQVVVMKRPAAGFIGNRLQYAMYREAVYMVEQGIATPEDIDKSLVYGFAPRYTNVGIFEHFDNCGLDLAKSIEDGLFPELCDDKATSQSINTLCAEGNIGSKSGKGFYTWTQSAEADFRKRTSTPYFRFFSHSGGVRRPE